MRASALGKRDTQGQPTSGSMGLTLKKTPTIQPRPGWATEAQLGS